MGLDSARFVKGYEILNELGAGGFGAVYRAHQAVLKRDVAIKVILPKHANKPDFIRRFTTEAEIVARLEHPHIVPLYDYWRDPEGAYIIMRFIDGMSLRQRLEMGIPDANLIIRIVEQLSSALHFAHRRQVIHRDLKPENVLLDAEGHVYLVDFGIAKDLSRAPDPQSEGGGTLIYASPEQFTSTEVTPQTDIYTLGLLVYEILTGSLPHEQTTPHAIKQMQFSEELPADDTLSADMMEVLRRATRFEPEERFENTLQVANAIRQILQGSSISEIIHPVKDASLETVAFLDNPYKGLSAFQEADRNEFYGREHLLDRLVDRLREPNKSGRFLAVVGPSGSGKSSVVKAGFLPRIREGAIEGSDNWFVVDMYPSNHPFEELEVALIRTSVNQTASLKEQLERDERGLSRAVNIILPNDNSQLLLVIDQFEELFTMVEDEATRALFLNSLLAAINDPHSRIRVIITLRADFYDKPLHYHEFGDMLRQHTEIVLPLSDEELEQAIRQPAEVLSVQFESGLVDTIIREVSDQPGMLPLLQFALVQLFDEREGMMLAFSKYQEMGGVVGALAGSADTIFDNLSENEQYGVRQLMLRLVSPGEGTEDTRRRVRLSELEAIPELNSLLDILGFARLLTFDYEQESRLPTVEIAHEALIRTWGRYRTWIDESRDELRIQRNLTIATREWKDSGEDPGFLAQAARLTQFELWADQTNLSLSADETEFLNQSLHARNEQQRIEDARKEHELELQQQAATRLRVLLAVVSVSLVIVGILGFIGFQNGVVAQEQAGTATVALGISEQNEQRAVIAESTAVQQSYEANALLLASRLENIERNNPFLAYGLGLSLLDTDRIIPIGVRTAVNDLILNSRVIYEITGHTDWINSVDVADNGRIAASGSQDKTVRIWDISTQQEIQRLEGHPGWVTVVELSPNATQVLSGDSHHKVYLWDIDSGELIHELTGHTGTINGLAFAPDGKTALSASNDTTLKLWDLETGELINTLQWHEKRVTDVVFSADGRNALSSGDDGLVILWEVEIGLPNRLFIGHEGEVATVAYSPNGRYALSGGHDNLVLEWDLTDFEALDPIRRFEGHELPLRRVVYSPDGQTALSTSWDETVIYWDLQTGLAIDVLEGHTDWVNDVGFTPDGQTALSGSRDKRLMIWDVGFREYSMDIDAHDARVNGITVAPDGQTFLSAGEDNQIILWDSTTGEAIRTYDGHTRRVMNLRFLSDGQTFLSGSYDESVILWDVATGEQLRVYGEAVGDEVEIPNGVNQIDIAPDEQTFLVAMEANLVQWDLETGEQLLQIDGPEILSDGHFHGVEYLPDSTTALSTLGNDLILWDLETGEAIRTYTGHTDWLNGIAISPDMQTIATSATDQSLILWDIESGVALRTFDEHKAPVRSVAFAPDGRTIASVSDDGQVIVWDVETGEPIRTLVGHQGTVYSVTYTFDGNAILSGGQDGTIKQWQIWLPDDALVEWAEANRQMTTPACEDFILYRSPNRFDCQTVDEG